MNEHKHGIMEEIVCTYPDCEIQRLQNEDDAFGDSSPSTSVEEWSDRFDEMEKNHGWIPEHKESVKMFIQKEIKEATKKGFQMGKQDGLVEGELQLDTNKILIEEDKEEKIYSILFELRLALNEDESDKRGKGIDKAVKNMNSLIDSELENQKKEIREKLEKIRTHEIRYPDGTRDAPMLTKSEVLDLLN